MKFLILKIIQKGTLKPDLIYKLSSRRNLRLKAGIREFILI